MSYALAAPVEVPRLTQSRKVKLTDPINQIFPAEFVQKSFKKNNGKKFKKDFTKI
jgi:hypothetical protein